MSSQTTKPVERKIFPARTVIGEADGPTFIIEKVVDCGGEAIVYKASATSDGHIVAVKLMFRLDDDDELKRFERVKEIHRRVRGTNVLPVEHSGIYEYFGDSYPFFVFPFVSGGRTLERILQDAGAGDLSAEKRKGPLIPYPHLLHYAIQAGTGLQAVHVKNVIHRDVKPSNILVAKEGADAIVRLMDLGVSKFADEENQPEEFKLTKLGSVRGTPAYLSPEAAGGKPSHLTDIWAFGAVLYEMVTGRSPFNFESGNMQSVLAKVVYGQLHPMPISDYCEGIDPRLVELIEKCLMHDPDARPQSMEEVLEALNRMQLRLPEVSMSEIPPPLIPVEEQLVNPDAETLAAHSTPPKPISAGEIASSPVVVLGEARTNRSTPDEIKSVTAEKVEQSKGSSKPLKAPVQLPKPEPVPSEWDEQTVVTKSDSDELAQTQSKRSVWPLVIAFLVIVASFAGYDVWVRVEASQAPAANSIRATKVIETPETKTPEDARLDVVSIVADVPVAASSSVPVASASAIVTAAPVASSEIESSAPEPTKTKTPPPRATRTYRQPSGAAPLPVPGHDYIPGIENY